MVSTDTHVKTQATGFCQNANRQSALLQSNALKT
jgi:hypothetical protein